MDSNEREQMKAMIGEQVLAVEALRAIRQDMATKEDLENVSLLVQAILHRLDLPIERSATRPASATRSPFQPPTKDESEVLTQWLTTPISTLMNWYRGLDFRVNQLENAIPELIAESVPTRTPARPDADSSPTNPEDSPLRKELNRLAEKVATLERDKANILFQLQQQHERIQKLELLHITVTNHERSATQTEQAAAEDSKRCSVELCNRWPQFSFCGIWICNYHRELIDIRGIYPESVPTQPSAPAEQDSTKTDTKENQRSATQTEQPGQTVRNVTRSWNGKQWVPIAESVPTQPPAPAGQDSIKTDTEKAE